MEEEKMDETPKPEGEPLRLTRHDPNGVVSRQMFDRMLVKWKELEGQLARLREVEHQAHYFQAIAEALAAEVRELGGSVGPVIIEVADRPEFRDHVQVDVKFRTTHAGPDVGQA